ncbi:hypothetical protein VPH35_077641 [Triticum aestivum]
MVCPHGCGVIDPRFHLRRWMMLPEGHGLYPSHASLRGYIHFFNLDTGKFVRVKLPVFNDHCVLDSAEGLLVMQRDEDTAIRLFHPFTGDVVDLPPLVTLVPHINPDLPGAFHPMQKFHYLRGEDHVGSSLPPPKLIATISIDKLTRPLCLVECDSQILVTGYTDSSLSRMLVNRLADLTLEKLISIRSIGDKALFLNNERSLSVSSNGALPTVVSTTIVQTSPKDGSLTQYHLSTDTWSRPMDGCILSGPVFGPCCLIYHIYTCCKREFWNKGQLYNRKKGCKWQVKGKWRLGKGA